MSCIMYAYLEKLGCIVRYFVNVSSDGRIGMSGHVEIIELESERKNETYVLHVYKPFPSPHRNSFPSNFSIKKFPTHRHAQTHIDSFWFSRVNVRLLFFFFLSNPLKRRVGDVPIRVTSIQTGTITKKEFPRRQKRESRTHKYIYLLETSL